MLRKEVIMSSKFSFSPIYVVALLAFFTLSEGKHKNNFNCTTHTAIASDVSQDFSCANNTGDYFFTISSQGKPAVFIRMSMLSLKDGDVFGMTTENSTDEQAAFFLLRDKQDALSFDFYVPATEKNLTLWAKFNSKNKEQRVFMGSFLTDCRVNVINSHVFHLPKYIQDNSMATCTFTVSAHDRKTSLADVTVKDINILGNSTMTVEGLDKFSPVIKAGSMPEYDFIGTNYNVSVHLDLSVLNQSLTFLLEYVTKDCSGMVQLESTQQWTPSLPPKSPEFLLSNVQCRWVLVGQNQNKVGLNVMNFSLNGVEDLLVVADGGRKSSPVLLQANQGTTHVEGLVILSSSKYMWLSISSPEYNENDNFMAAVTLAGQGGHMRNNGTLTFDSTTESATFLLEVDEGKLVFLTSDSPLKSGEVEVRSDFYKDSPLLHIFTPGSASYPLVSTGNKMMVTAKGLNDQKFVANFTGVLPGCHQTTLGTNGFYSLSGNCSSTCSWAVNPANSGKTERFLLTLSSFNLVVGDNLTVSTLKSPFKPLVAVNATFPSVPPIEMNAADGAYVNIERGGCLVANSTLVTGSVSPVLGTTTVQQLSKRVVYVLQSPKFPNQYPLNSVRSVKLVGSGIGGLHITFRTLDLRPGHVLMLTSGGNKTVNLTGSQQPQDIVLSQPELSAEFLSPVTSSYVSGYGFDTRITPVDSAVDVHGEHGTVTTPSYPAPVKKNSMFVWMISVPNLNKKNASVAVKFNVSVNSNDSVSIQNISQSLTVYDGNSVRSPRLTNLTGSSNLLSRSDTILVVYAASPTADGLSVKIDFTTYTCNLSDICKSSGICIHEDWRCNGVNDCGDNSDELACSFQPTPSPSPSPEPTPAPSTKTGGVSVAAFVVTVLIALVLGAVGAILVPVAMRRYRTHRYSTFSNVAVSE